MTNRFPIVLDLETKRTFRETPDPAKLGISVVGVFDFASGQKLAFFENEFSELFRLIENCSLIIGYNILGFDIPVLSPYYHGKLTDFPSLDLCELIREKIGRRIGLADVAKATLGKGKSGHGLKAIELYKEGKFEELKNYCLDDVEITKEVYEYAQKYRELYIPDGASKKRIPISVDLDQSRADINLGLPF